MTIVEKSAFKIAIIGAGPAGCTLARLLVHKKVPVDVVIFEGESSLDARTQGGTLDLHTDTGIEALKQCGLHAEFLKLARFDGEAFRICNKYFQTYVHFAGTKNEKSSRGRPEIDRLQLRRLLIDSLPGNVIRWNFHLNAIEEVDGQYQLHFRDQPSETGFDVVIGADGAWSHVRRLLTSDKPYYSGISGVSFEITAPQEKHPELYARVERGSFAVFSERKSLWAQQLGSGNISVGYWSVHDEDWIKQFKEHSDDIDFLRQACLEELEDWNPNIRALLEAADTKPMIRNLYMLPVGNSWEHRTGVTLMGDAAHLFTPFAGEGVNLAMTDAVKLAEAIDAACHGGVVDTLDTRIQAYETEMFERARQFQQLTLDMMNAGFAEDFEIEKYISRAAANEIPKILLPAFRLSASCYFRYWRWRYAVPAGDRS